MSEKPLPEQPPRPGATTDAPPTAVPPSAVPPTRPGTPAPPGPDPGPGPGPDPGAGDGDGDGGSVGYREVFRVREFRWVFMAHLFSLLGVVVSEIALTVLVYRLTGSPFLSALAFALGMLPYVIGGTLLAGIADRYPARRVLVSCDLVCAGCAALMALPATPVVALLALRCAIAMVAPVFSGTRMATLVDILGEGELFVLGRSLLRIVSQSAVLAGFGIGGVLLTVVSPRGALVITLGTFLLSALLLRAGTKRRPARSGEGGSLARYSLGGVRTVLADRRMRALLLFLWVPPMFVVVPEALAAAYADQLGLSTVWVGLLMCAMPVGTVLAELYVGSALSPAARARIALPLGAFLLLPLVGYAWVPEPGWAVALMLLSGAGFAYTLGADRWFVDSVPAELRGRAMTVHTAGLMTIQGVGMALAGAAAEVFAVSTVVAGAGVLGTTVCVLLALEVRRVLRGPGEGPPGLRREPVAATAGPPGPKGETGLTAI
ncbi:MFS transporter [Streptomyces uncialis]|uniref:MFS transporter n=1 Tax=Streptomyces uncialis TaxID=1048205 RepID=UPI0037904B1C